VALRSLRSLLCIAVLIVPLLYIGIGAQRFVSSLITYLNSSKVLAAIVSREAAHALNRDVHISRVTISGSLWSAVGENTIDLADVRVGDANPSIKVPFASAAHVIVKGSIRNAFSGDAHSPYASELKVVKPAVHIARDSGGKWNFADLAKPKQAAGRMFTDRIAVEGGEVTFDSAVQIGSGPDARPVNAGIYSISGLALLGEDHSISIDTSASPDPAYADRLHITGIVEPDPGRASLHLVATKVNLKELSARYLPARFGAISSGEADIAADE